MDETDIRRFWSKVNKTKGCWLWTASLGRKDNYGRFTYQNKPIGAHKFSFLLNGGTLKEGEWVLHTCDNKLCVNPAHLYAGTPTDNNRDTVNRGRHVSSFKPMRGIDNPNSKLDDDKVRLVRRLRKEGLSLQKISEQVDCSRGVVRNIIEGITWKHVK